MVASTVALLVVSTQCSPLAPLPFGAAVGVSPLISIHNSGKIRPFITSHLLQTINPNNSPPPSPDLRLTTHQYTSTRITQ